MRWGLQGPEGEQTAFAIEAAAIDLLRLDLDNRASGLARGKGRISAEEVDITLGATPANFDPEHRLMLVRVARQFRVDMDEEALYVATRQWWRIGAERMKLGTSRSPEWAMAVYRGVVRAVYRIERWRSPTAGIDTPHRHGCLVDGHHFVVVLTVKLVVKSAVSPVALIVVSSNVKESMYNG